MFPFLLVLHAIVAAVLVTFILMQRSEGGGLGMGGSPSGLMSARGAADFLTRATSVSAALFVALSILLAFLAATRHNQALDTSLARRAATAPTAVPPPAIDPGAPPAAAPNAAAPASPPDNSSVPLAH
ncbi:preprotein translocase subunit SecG [uncultured Sphingomonas sp.]|uniref:preprotein translocase subunit SecG n=1 Tax=uncultured Sphingomonas sp. TaxID=158754 RepID=UPI0035CB24D4